MGYSRSRTSSTAVPAMMTVVVVVARRAVVVRRYCQHSDVRRGHMNHRRAGPRQHRAAQNRCQHDGFRLSVPNLLSPNVTHDAVPLFRRHRVGNLISRRRCRWSDSVAGHTPSPSYQSSDEAALSVDVVADNTSQCALSRSTTSATSVSFRFATQYLSACRRPDSVRIS